MQLIYLKSALKCDSFDVAIGIKIPFFRVLVTIEPGHSLLQFVTVTVWFSINKIYIFRANSKLFRFIAYASFFLYTKQSSSIKNILSEFKINWFMAHFSFFLDKKEDKCQYSSIRYSSSVKTGAWSFFIFVTVQFCLRHSILRAEFTHNTYITHFRPKEHMSHFLLWHAVCPKSTLFGNLPSFIIGSWPF